MAENQNWQLSVKVLFQNAVSVQQLRADTVALTDEASTYCIIIFCLV